MTTISHLTEDLLSDILSRLPVKFLLQCRCISKTWLALVANPTFIKQHLNQSHSRPPNLLFQTYPGNVLKTLDSKFLHEPVDLNVELPPSDIVGSCNGLLCLSDFKFSTYLFNPSTREQLQLPSNGIDETNLIDMTVGFGYTPVSEEYKVVIIACTIVENVNPYKIEVRIYTIGTDSWRSVEASPQHPCYFMDEDAIPYFIDTEGVHVNGALHWVGTGDQGNQTITSFDLTNETFATIPTPDCNEDYTENLNIRMLEGCLVMVRWLQMSEHVDLWVMTSYGVKESWIKQFTFGPSIVEHYDELYPLLIRKNGEILLQLGIGSVSVEICGMHLQVASDLRLYDRVVKRDRVAIICGTPNNFWTTIYVEALTSLASLMAGNRLEGL